MLESDPTRGRPHSTHAHTQRFMVARSNPGTDKRTHKDPKIHRRIFIVAAVPQWRSLEHPSSLLSLPHAVCPIGDRCSSRGLVCEPESIPLFGRRVDTSGFQSQVMTQQATLDTQLNLPSIRNALAQDYDRYHNHCLRVYTFSKYFLPESVEKEMPNAFEILAVALAYHDLCFSRTAVSIISTPVSNKCIHTFLLMTTIMSCIHKSLRLPESLLKSTTRLLVIPVELMKRSMLLSMRRARLFGPTLPLRL